MKKLMKYLAVTVGGLSVSALIIFVGVNEAAKPKSPLNRDQILDRAVNLEGQNEAKTADQQGNAIDLKE